MIRFGSWSTALGLGALFGVVVAAALASTQRNSTANRLLAALLLAIVLQLVPYVIGYAGFYDVWPRLSFVPLETSLAIGPLVYLHVLRLTSSSLPRNWWRHLLPVLLQFTYYCIVFPFSLATKNHWDDAVHEPWIAPFETLASTASLAIYLLLAWRQHRAYQRWLSSHISNREDYRLEWLRNFIVALALMLLAWIVISAATLTLKLNYFDRFPFYLGLTALVFYLGLEGWRHADRRYPLPDAPPIILAATQRETLVSEERDWRAQGEAWLARLQAAGWWRDPELSLERLAGQLGTNTAYLSRALNEGLGQNFSEVIARLRVAEVQRCLAQGTSGDLLALALAAGFSSKSSFNRVFKAQTGQTPSQFRDQHSGARAEICSVRRLRDLGRSASAAARAWALRPYTGAHHASPPFHNLGHCRAAATPGRTTSTSPML
jgi:AraC-like DNA-binding protein